MTSYSRGVAVSRHHSKAGSGFDGIFLVDEPRPEQLVCESIIEERSWAHDEAEID